MEVMLPRGRSFRFKNGCIKGKAKNEEIDNQIMSVTNIFRILLICCLMPKRVRTMFHISLVKIAFVLPIPD